MARCTEGVVTPGVDLPYLTRVKKPSGATPRARANSQSEGLSRRSGNKARIDQRKTNDAGEGGMKTKGGEPLKRFSQNGLSLHLQFALASASPKM